MNKDPDKRVDGEVARRATENNELSQLHARLRPLLGELGAVPHSDFGSSDADDRGTSTNRLEDFAAASEGWFWETDADLRFIYVSSTLKRVNGLDPEWYYGKTRADIGCPETVEPEEWQAHLDILERREPFKGFTYPQFGSGKLVWIETSGVPSYSDDGKFLGYRGTGRDITPLIETRMHADQLTNAIAGLDEMFALWDADDRLILFNERYRELNDPIAEFLKPGAKFEDLLRRAMDAGLFPEAVGIEEEWIAERLHSHRNPGDSCEMQRQDGRWILVREQKLPDGAMISHSTDITARKQAELAFAEKNRMLVAAFRTMPDGVRILDSDGNMVAWNDQLFEVMDVPAETIISSPDPGKAYLEFLAERGDFGDGDVEDIVVERRDVISTGENIDQERQLPTGKWIECRGNPIEGGGYILICRDVTERTQARERLQYLASIDALTGINNRRSFLEIAGEEFKRAERYNRELSFLLVDVDYFKSINDRFGHATGDTVLRQVVAACRSVLRGSDEIGRIGGEEFAVVLPETGHEAACTAAERLRWAVEAIVVPTGEDDTSVTVSVGIATADDKHKSIDDLMADADAALYKAKRAGRNRSVHLNVA